MIANAIERILTVSENLGIIGFFVDAKNEAAKQYYEQFGFIPLPDNPLELFLPSDKIIWRLYCIDVFCGMFFKIKLTGLTAKLV